MTTMYWRIKGVHGSHIHRNDEVCIGIIDLLFYS